MITTVGGIESFRHHPSGIDEDRTTLKDCPFCAHPAGYYESTDAGDKHPLGVTCTNTSCGVATPKQYQTRELAATAWNRRTSNEEVIRHER